MPPDWNAPTFPRTVNALLHTTAGRPAEAIEQAEAVATETGATYLYNDFAYVAAAGAYQQLGDSEHAILSSEAAIARAMSVGDVIATALATSAFQLISGKTHPAHDQRTPLGEGWTTLLALLVAAPSAVVVSAGD